MTALAPTPHAREGIKADWIAVDWGTSNLRAWAIGPAGEVLATARSPEGMGTLQADGFEAVLLGQVGHWLSDGRTTDVVACGMVGARQGWAEARYRSVPCPPMDATQAAPAPTTDPRLRVHLLPGLMQSPPPDVMRGEETQIAGYLCSHPQFDGVICLPGTHSKWAQISAGEVVGFSTFMTGELFDLLASRSILRHSMEADPEAWSETDFTDALEETLSRPERVAPALFGLRASALIGSGKVQSTRARLSGYLIGLELAGAKAWWLGRDVVLVGAPRLSHIYAQALQHCGLDARQADASELTLAGLAAARATLKTGDRT